MSNAGSSTGGDWETVYGRKTIRLPRCPSYLALSALQTGQFSCDGRFRNRGKKVETPRQPSVITAAQKHEPTVDADSPLLYHTADLARLLRSGSIP